MEETSQKYDISLEYLEIYWGTKNILLLHAMFPRQGWRISMEDAHTVQMSIDGDPTHNFFGGRSRDLILQVYWAFQLTGPNLRVWLFHSFIYITTPARIVGRRWVCDNIPYKLMNIRLVTLFCIITEPLSSYYSYARCNCDLHVVLNHCILDLIINIIYMTSDHSY